MNKLKVFIAGLFIACLGIGVVSAQAANQTPPKKSTSPAASTAGAGNSAGGATSSGQHLKKDGTPDMRYKENKAAAKSTGTPAAKKTSTGTKKAAPKAAAPAAK